MMVLLRTVAGGVAILRLRATGPRRVHAATVEAVAIGTRELSTRLRPTLRRGTKLTLPILRLRTMREIAEILRALRTTLEARPTLHPRALMHLGTELRTILRETAALLRAKLTMVMAVVHPRTLRAELRTILRETASLLRAKLTMVAVMHPRSLRAKLRTILGETLTALRGTKLVVVLLHARPLRAILRELLTRLRTHRPVAMMLTRPGLRSLILRPRLAGLLRAIVLRLPLLPAALEALRHLLLALHFAGKMLAHLPLETLPHLRLKLLVTLHPSLRSAIAALRPLRRGARSTGLRPGTPRLGIAPIIPTRRPLAALVEWGPAISIATAVTSVTTRLSRLIRSCLRLRLARLRRIATILRATHRASVELREKFIRRDAPIATAIELLQGFRRVLQFLGIDHAIVIRIEQIEERRAATAHIASRVPTTALPFGPLPFAHASLRQALRRIRRLRRLRRRLRSSVLRAEDRCRERHRDRGEEKRFS